MPNVFISSFSSPSLSGPCHKTPACDIQQGTATPGQDISAASKESSFRCCAAPETYLLGKLWRDSWKSADVPVVPGDHAGLSSHISAIKSIAKALVRGSGDYGGVE